jgi:hypothetical protein
MSKEPKDDIIEDIKDDDSRFEKIPLTPEQKEMVEKMKERIQNFVKEAFTEKK